MAKTQQAVLEVKLEQKSLIADLEKQKRSLVSSKEELNKLNAAYKQGSITLEEYAADAVRIEAILKKQNAAYQNNQKAVTGHKSKIDELIKSNSKLGDSFSEAAKDMNIAGVNIGGLGSKFASFITPAGAAVGVVTALGAAYARSAAGAKDLEFASNQLASATSLLTNSFANMITSAEDGEGLFTGLLNAILDRYAPGISAISKAMAQMNEDAEDLIRKEKIIRTSVNDRLTENQEKLTEISDEQTRYTDKIRLGNEILKNLTTNQEELTGVLREQLKIIEQQSKLNPNNDALLDLKLEKEREISKITQLTTKNIEAQKRANEGIVEAENKRLLIQKEADSIEFSAAKILGDKSERPDSVETIGDTGVSGDIKMEADIAAMRLSSKKRLADDLDKINKKNAEREAEHRVKSLEIYKEIEEAKLDVANNVAGSLAGLFDEQTVAFKVFASAQTIMSTYSSAQKSYDALAGIPFIGPALGFAAAAAAVATGLGNLARINNVQFAEGGWTGPGGKYDVAGVVHADEYVVPKQINNNPMARPHIQALEAMRVKPYADGGFVTQQNTMSAQQSLAMVNAVKNLPPPIADVREITRAQDRIRARESISRLGRK